MGTQAKMIITNEMEKSVTFPELFVIKYQNRYWAGSAYYSSNINEARLYKTREQAELVIATLNLAGVVVRIKITEDE